MEFYVPRQVSYGRQSECAPVVTLEILLDDVRRFRIVENPILAPETIVLIYNVIDATIPVKYHQQVVYQ